MRFLIAAVVAVSAVFACQAAEARVLVTYAVPHVVHYAPAPVFVATPMPVYVAAPIVAYRAYRPVVTTYIAPAPVLTRAVVAHPVVTTRYRPILGGTVTRTRYRYAPANVIVTPY